MTMDIKSDTFTGTFTFETREVGGITYTSDPFTGEWEIDEDDSGDGGFADDLIEAATTGKLDLDLGNTTVQMDSLNGEPVYRMVSSIADDPDVETLVLWVNPDDMLIRQLRMDGHVSASEYEGLVPQGRGELFQTTLFRFSEFNEPVVIQAPEVTHPPVSAALGELYTDEVAGYSISYPSNWEFTAPTLIVWGENDPIFPAEGAHPYLRDLPDAELHLLNTGHFALEEDGQSIVELIRDFMVRKITGTGEQEEANR